MKVLVAGAGGQLGRALQANPAGHEVIAPPESAFDLLDGAAVQATIRAVAPDLVVNAAAYTAVDRAESERDRALAINATAAGALAEAARAVGAGFVHVSTDFIFDGESPHPYPVDAAPRPLSVYGETKLLGEQAVRAAHADALIIRTAWVYAAAGHNFMQTMLRLMREGREVRVVADQIGTPTHAASLARAIWALVADRATGTFHWTDAGVASWYDFAVAIGEEALEIGLLARPAAVVPIRTIDYPTPARRPAMSVLDKTDTWARIGPANHWRTELRLALHDVKEG